jgi:DNA repair exonuclease SbcCD ATPase subunit
LETIKLVLTQFNDEVLTLSILILVIFLGLLIFVWSLNKKKYHQLGHEIPAGIIKNYLDSIIQNSEALKSSLFRGGGLEVGEGIPSVLPVSQLNTSKVVSAPLNSLNLDSELLTQKEAEISQLQMKLSEKEKMIRELERRLDELQKSSKQNHTVAKDDKGESSAEIVNLKEQLKIEMDKSNNSVQQIGTLTKERDDLRSKLQEYEIIEDDLANLKRLQNENDDLRKRLAAKGEVVEPMSFNEPENIKTESPAHSSDDALQPISEMAEVSNPVPAMSSKEGSEKSAEDLLSEFEKMLG